MRARCATQNTLVAVTDDAATAVVHHSTDEPPPSSALSPRAQSGASSSLSATRRRTLVASVRALGAQLQRARVTRVSSAAASSSLAVGSSARAIRIPMRLDRAGTYVLEYRIGGTTVRGVLDTGSPFITMESACGSVWGCLREEDARRSGLEDTYEVYGLQEDGVTRWVLGDVAFEDAVDNNIAALVDSASAELADALETCDVVVCFSAFGAEAGAAAPLVAEKVGATDCRNLCGGIVAWFNAGFALVNPNTGTASEAVHPGSKTRAGLVRPRRNAFKFPKEGEEGGADAE